METGRVIKVTGITLEVNDKLYNVRDKQIQVTYGEDGKPLIDCLSLLNVMVTFAEQKAIIELAEKLHEINLTDLFFCIQNIKEPPK